MTELEKLLKKAGLRKSELAELTGVWKHTVSRWNKSPPKYIVALLECMARNR